MEFLLGSQPHLDCQVSAKIVTEQPTGLLQVDFYSLLCCFIACLLTQETVVLMVLRWEVRIYMFMDGIERM